MKERDIQRQILSWLKLHRILHWRNNSGAAASSYKGKRYFVRFGALGSPDIFAVHNGKIYGIEVKGAHGYLSDNQREFSGEFEKAGGVYIIARKLEDVMHLWGA